MKKLETVIKPYLLEALKDALRDQGLKGMTISEVKDFGAALKAGAGTGGPLAPGFAPRLKVEIVVANEDVEQAIETIQRIRLVIGPGEGVLINEVDDVIRIRTAEHGKAAI